MPVQSWRCPVALQVKSAVFAAAGVALAAVFFPVWFGVPVMAILGIWGLGMCVRRGGVLVDADVGLLVVRVGPLTRRVGLADITAVRVDRAQVSIARSGGGEISFYAWRRGRLDGWLRVPVVAGDVAHAISRAAAAAVRADDADRLARRSRAARPVRFATAARWPRRPLALALLGCVGAVSLAAAFLVRVSWANPVMTALGVALALGLGVAGLFYVLSSVWLLLAGRAQSPG